MYEREMIICLTYEFTQSRSVTIQNTFLPKEGAQELLQSN